MDPMSNFKPFGIHGEFSFNLVAQSEPRTLCLVFLELRAFDQAMLVSYSFVTIYGNLYLYRFLKTQTDKNIALKDLGVKKSRKRNVIPAKVGMFNAIALVGTYIVYIVIYRCGQIN